MPTGQIVAFKIRPYRSRLYYTVRVFTTLRDMRRYALTHRLDRLGARFRGLASTWTKLRKQPNGRWHRLNEAGEVLLSRRHIGAEVVSHECTHLALAWAQRRKVNPMGNYDDRKAGPQEEAFCYVLGQLVAGVYRGLWHHKVVT